MVWNRKRRADSPTVRSFLFANRLEKEDRMIHADQEWGERFVRLTLAIGSVMRLDVKPDDRLGKVSVYASNLNGLTGWHGIYT